MEQFWLSDGFWEYQTKSFADPSSHGKFKVQRSTRQSIRVKGIPQPSEQRSIYSRWHAAGW